ncbi:ArsR/SmtB family transcription factor [Proteiniclasticum ruminis]|uniref:Transcriptional regulator, ArsR family n=1 Tax=Proteiniclasticum ruminis TaxID=398199 RepID=A0A1I4Z2A4_9CLOT|nr:metalloregulator ArsR/SmtB family transcription factor [Proteiniclasticum ruminis]SFN44307.1 transcriptional regulator, ArsR family [Proteiniclasticum ruminis]
MENNINKFTNAAELLKTLGHPVRLCILKGILATGGCNVSHMTDCLDLPQSTISQHIQKLKSAGIIEGERKGLEITYKLVHDKARQIIESIELQEDK